MQNRRYQRTRRTKKYDGNNLVIKTTLQSITALIIFLIVWGMSVSSNPHIELICDKIKYYLNYTYDIQSVFNNFNIATEGNDD